jgi:hypothetical protein
MIEKRFEKLAMLLCKLADKYEAQLEEEEEICQSNTPDSVNESLQPLIPMVIKRRAFPSPLPKALSSSRLDKVMTHKEAISQRTYKQKVW